MASIALRPPHPRHPPQPPRDTPPRRRPLAARCALWKDLRDALEKAPAKGDPRTIGGGACL